MLKGRAVSSGFGIGPALMWVDGSTAQPTLTMLPEHEIPAERKRLEQAVSTARAELQALHAKATARLGTETATIIEAQILMLDDPELIGTTLDRVHAEGLAVPGVLAKVGDELAQMLAALDDPYLKERAADVRDVTARLLRHLTGNQGRPPLIPSAILVANDLPPSELIQMVSGQIAALVLLAGGDTSHTAILARSLGIPAVFGLGDAGQTIATGVTVLVDGDAGLVSVDPSPDLMAAYSKRIAERQQELQALKAFRDLPAKTLDGHPVRLAANIGSAQEATAARAAGADGVGLFRTEFLFLDRQAPPTEAEQLSVYRETLTAMTPHPVLFRTLDIGGDKPVPFLALTPEENPFLGLRGIRLSQVFIPLFRTQLRALLQATDSGRVQVMVPMLSSKQELLWVREQFASVTAELRAEGHPCSQPPDLGVMIETPAAALLANELAPLVDFFSIGMNDLTQYTLAVDRLNPRVAHLYDPYHPAVLRLVQMTVQGAHRHGRWVGLCGELAGDPRIIPILLGLGLDELSMSIPQLARVKQAIRSTNLIQATDLANKALRLTDGDEVRALIDSKEGH